MIQLYTGNGKGKTTAACGLAIRAAGAGLNVFIGQFCKGRNYNELKALRRFKKITIEQFGMSCFIKKGATPQDVQCAQKGLKRVQTVLSSKRYQMVILDEITVAIHLKLLEITDVLRVLRSSPSAKEIILTGRYAHPRLIRIADLVSVIQEKKHYYQKGIQARRGIEY